MKASTYIFGFALLTLASCSRGLYTGSEYDDLYYQSSDVPVARVGTIPGKVTPEGNLKSGDYYDNIYANDTLVSKEYSDAVDSDEAAVYDNAVNNYYDYSYAGRLNRFYGNYFNPYWRDPFYYSWMPSMSFGFGGYPYSYGYYDPFFYDSFYSPYYYNPYYYGGFYGGFGFGGLYSSFYNPFYYGSYYSPFYYGNYYRYNDAGDVSYGRRERPSTLSSRWNTGSGSAGVTGNAPSRRGTYSSSAPAYQGQTSTQAISTARRSGSTTTTQQRPVTQNPSRSSSQSISNAASRRASQPAYNSANRTYTPSYSNPRMSTRPSYNNTRVNPGFNQYNQRRSISTSRPSSGERLNQSSSGLRRSSSTYSPSRAGSSYSSPRSYSMPSSRRSDGGSFSRSYSSPGRSFGSGSSGSFSRSSSSGSYSGGGSSSSGSSRSSGGSSGRR